MIRVTGNEIEEQLSKAYGTDEEMMSGQSLHRPCYCMTEDPGDGYGERVVTHSGGCVLHPAYDGNEKGK